MTMPSPLLLAIHHHQPDGNFGHVFEECYEVCYGPFLALVEEFPQVRLSLHHTGALFEWIEQHRPDYFARLRRLVERKQVELLGGGFYEPILSVLPERDAVGQLTMMNAYLEHHFGVRPRGMWLAERVWEPQLPIVIARAGLQYTLVDDHHFRAAGMTGPLNGYYVTEKVGVTTAVFPIDMQLRQRIPFSEVDEAIATVETEGARGAVTYGDDGEKFGVWPGTAEWVWKKGWLRKFFERLSSSERIQTTTFSDWMSAHPASGRVYLPTASYEEMGEWALPTSAQPAYHHVREIIQERKDAEHGRAFVRGGTWQSFMSKYAEANFMHKKMLHVSQGLEIARAHARPGSEKAIEDATRALYRAQCNCSYWHGLFGGLYLNYLRAAVYRNLIDAEVAADEINDPTHRPAIQAYDFDGDLEDELLMTNGTLAAYVKPSAGGGIFELDYRPKRFNVGNVLSRREEGYHAKLRAAVAHKSDAAAAPQSIHDLVAVKSSGLDSLLNFDRHLRMSFLDHLLPTGTTLADVEAVRHEELGGLPTARYEATRADRHRPEIELAATARIGDSTARIVKTITLDGGVIQASYRISSSGGRRDVLFAPELALTLLAGDAPDRYYQVPGKTLDAAAKKLASRGVLEGVSALEMVNDWDRFVMRIVPSQGAQLWRYPLETASQSESGFERTYQGSMIHAVWPLQLGDGVPPSTFTLRIDFSEVPNA